MTNVDVKSNIISISKLLGNYNLEEVAPWIWNIISISKLLGNYNLLVMFMTMLLIISISKLLGNYNERRYY